MEWNGMEWNGMEWNGMEWNGMEWNGMEWNGMEWNGMEWNRTDDWQHHACTAKPPSCLMTIKQLLRNSNDIMLLSVNNRIVLKLIPQ